MIGPKQIFEELMAMAGVAVDGPNPWDIRVKDDRTYARVIREKNLGLGESYMDGWWECRRVDELINRILIARVDKRVRESLRLLLPIARARLFNRQTKRLSRDVAEKHYDLGNDFFTSFLDPYNQYSCAYFDDTEDLDQAQLNKLDLICRKLALAEDDHLLDIGFGWGGFAKYAAETHGCKVTGINISEEQVSFAAKFCKELPVEVVYCDYRDLKGSFSKIVSVGMFEHVGPKNYRTFMETAHRRLEEDGVFMLHTIGSNESELKCDPWISKYIFPHGKLPSIAQIGKAVEGLFVIEDLHNLGPHYDKTLMSWHRRFQAAWPRLKEKYGERFKRMWEYYLLSCAGSFRSRSIQLWQIVLTKYGTTQPKCRY
ncbi:cyclopropane fatty acyl phospholipid synthase [Thermodesulfobacteriota bacterium]